MAIKKHNRPGEKRAAMLPAFVVTVLLATAPVRAQDQVFREPGRNPSLKTPPVPWNFGPYGISQLDAYGNAGPATTRISPFGAMDNLALQRAMRTQQRLPDRRTSFLDNWANLYRHSFQGLPGKTSFAQSGYGIRRLFDTYGGFEHRNLGYEPQDPPTLLNRHRALVAATAGSAPITRQLLEFPRPKTTTTIPYQWTSYPYIPSQLDESETTPTSEPTASDEPPTDPFAQPDTRPRVSNFLTQRIAARHDRVTTEAWRYFQEGNFQRARGLFETALTLDETDQESRLGEILSCIQLRRTQTAVEIMKKIVLSSESPFVPGLRLADRYDPEPGISRGEADTLRSEFRILNQRLQADIRARPAELRDERFVEFSMHISALNVMLAYYLGGPEEALRAAQAMERNMSSPVYVEMFNETTYPSWSALLQEIVDQENGRDR
jgi:hypothetical protein